jgi:hypothetical protein
MTVVTQASHVRTLWCRLRRHRACHGGVMVRLPESGKSCITPCECVCHANVA